MAERPAGDPPREAPWSWRRALLALVMLVFLFPLVTAAGCEVSLKEDSFKEERRSGTVSFTGVEAMAGSSKVRQEASGKTHLVHIPPQPLVILAFTAAAAALGSSFGRSRWRFGLPAIASLATGAFLFFSLWTLNATIEPEGDLLVLPTTGWLAALVLVVVNVAWNLVRLARKRRREPWSVSDPWPPEGRAPP